MKQCLQRVQGRGFRLCIIIAGLFLSLISRVSPAHAAGNLLTNGGFEAASTTGWNVVNGGNGWAVTGYAHEGTYGVISSFAWGTLSQEVDLLANGYTAGSLDAQPDVTASAYVLGTAGWKVGCSTDPYAFKVELRNASHGVITTYDTGNQNAGGSWTQLSHLFSGYGTGLRYIYFEMKGADCEYWGGQYGSVFDEGSLVITDATDSTPPSVTALSPVDGATNIATNANLVMTFGENTRAGTGTLTIRKSADDSTVETITVSGALLSGNGTTQLTLNPDTTFTERTGYYVVWSANAFKDASGNHTAAQTSSTYWNFTTGDFTPPAPSGFSPASAAYIRTATQEITFTTDENATCRISLTDQAYADMSRACSGGGTTSQSCTTPSLGSDGAKTVYIACTDGTNADTAETNESLSYTLDSAAPNFTTLTTTLADTSVVIDWTTDEAASSRVEYGSTMSYGLLTAETDTSPRVTSHSVAITGLPVCTTFSFRLVGTDAAGNIAYSSEWMFTTTGCTNAATVNDQERGSVPSEGGTVTLTTSGGTEATVIAPNDGARTSLTIQIKKIDTATVMTGDVQTATPSARAVIGEHTYDIKAIDGTSLVTSFAEPITISIEYTDDDVSGYQESSLQIYRWDGAAWQALGSCSVDSAANVVTCTTTHFSTFGLFGSALTSGSTSSSATTTVQSGGGRRPETLSQLIAAARSSILDRFASSLRSSVADADAPATHAAASVPTALSTDDERRLYRATQKVISASEASSLRDLRLSRIAERQKKLLALVDDSPVLYRDVGTDAWFAPYVAKLITTNIATGYSDGAGKPTGEFGVANPVTYAEVLKMALNAAGTDLPVLPPPRNVSARGTWAASYVAQAEARKLKAFVSSLDVHAPATRGAVVDILLGVLGIPIANQNPDFADVRPNHPYAKAIATADFYGIVTGDTDSSGQTLRTFRPDATINRAEVAKIVALVREVMQR